MRTLIALLCQIIFSQGHTMKETEGSKLLAKWMTGVLIVSIVIYNLQNSGIFKGWQPSETLVRTLIIGAFFGIIGGVAVWVRSLWRKRKILS